MATSVVAPGGWGGLGGPAISFPPCGWQRPPPTAAPPSAGSGANPAASELRRLFLELGLEEGRRQRVSELLERCSEHGAAECLPVVLQRLVNFPSAHGLGIYALCELLRLHPMVLVQRFAPAQIYDLFSREAVDRPALGFLHAFLGYRQSQGLDCEQEVAKLQKLLLRRARQQDLRRVPASPARTCLCRIWLDVPSARPERQTMLGCCARWIGDPGASLAEKEPCLILVKQDFEQRGRPEGDAWLVGLLLEQVCRDPVGHSPDLQHLLWPLGSALEPKLLEPMLSSLAQERGRLATLWVCLCLWVPQAQPEGFAAPWPQGTPAPVHALLTALLTAFQDLEESEDLCRVSVLSLGAIASGGEGPLALAACELLLVLYQNSVLSKNVWFPLVPLLEHKLAACSLACADLLARLQWRIAGASEGGSPPGESSAAPCGAQGGPDLRQQFSADPPRVPVNSRDPNGSPQGPQMQGQGPQMQCQEGYAPQGGYVSPYPQQGGFPSAPGGGYPQQQQLAQGLAQPGFFQSAPAGDGYQQPPPGFATGAGACPPDQVEIKYEQPRVGLQNMNNTCYMNSFMQSLFMTSSFLQRIFVFQLTLKKNASKVDREDFEFGLKCVELLQRTMAKMALTRYKHTDLSEILTNFPAEYRSGEQQDVTETIRFVFDKLGSYEQPLIREVFSGELSEKTQCQICGNLKSRPETFSDLVLPVPKEADVLQAGVIPTTQALLDQRIRYELMDEKETVFCDRCQQNTRAGKWCEIVSPPAHLCITLNRFSFDMQFQSVKERTPVRIDGVVQIGPFTYMLYMVIVHTGQTAASGHYYAVGRRSEDLPRGDEWYRMDDSQVKTVDGRALLMGDVSEKQKYDNPYVLFYRCQQAPPTPPARVPRELAEDVIRQDTARNES